MPGEKPSHIEYTSPEELKEHGEMPHHAFDLMIEGKKIGGAELDYYSRPIPFYQLTDLYVDYEYQGRGYASEILQQIEEFLKKRRKPGVLTDAILPDAPSAGMYARRGWKEVPGGLGLHVYNWPEDIDVSVLKNYSLRYTDYDIRQQNKVDKEDQNDST